MNRRLYLDSYLPDSFYSITNRWLFLFLLLIPVSCTAQQKVSKKNSSLEYISTASRSDGKGYVLRFHLSKKPSSFNYAQPSPYLIQLELYGNNRDTSNIKLIDHHNIIKKIHYASLKDGIGIELHLTKKGLFKAAVYPDKAGNDLLVGLTKKDKTKLAAHIKSMKPLAWSNIPDTSTLAGNQIYTRDIDTTYQKIRRKMRFDTVVLDPGHGGHDTGAIGWHHTLEKNVALAIAKKVGYYINKYLPDVKVVYTRDSDKFVGLQELGRIANRADGDLFVCIHTNAARSRRAHGTETFFLGLERSKTALKVMERENHIVSAKKEHPEKISKQQMMIYELANSGNITNSQMLAGMIQKQFKNRAKRRSRGVKQARFVVLYHASMPAVLVETGFITNPAECKYLTSKHGQSIIASAIFRAIRSYKNRVDQSMNFNADSGK